MNSYHSPFYPFPIDLNEDQSQQLLSSNPMIEAASSSSSPSYPIFITTQEDHGAYYNRESQVLDHQQQQAHGVSSCDHHPTRKHDNNNFMKLSVRKKEERNEHQRENSEMKWVSSKIRLVKKMMISDQTVADVPKMSTHQKLEDHHHQKDTLLSSSSPLPHDNSSSITSSNISNSPIRVCSDCNTTKTPLWRSGPRGPKSLCNACGIRQRKARRAMAAAAAAAGANGAILAADKVPTTKTKSQHKDKGKSNNSHLPFKKRRRYTVQGRGSRKKLCLEDLTIILSKNSAFQGVFPQDEKEAAILLMALSYGLVHG